MRRYFLFYVLFSFFDDIGARASVTSVVFVGSFALLPFSFWFLLPVYVMSDISDRNFKNLGFQKNKNTLKTLNPFIEKERKADKYRAKICK
jgi:hypothetical protein